MVMLTVQNETDYFASSEGSQIVTPHLQARLVAVAVTRADDGMDLFREQTFEAETVDGLPKQADLEAAMRDLGKSLEALRKAPVTEPFDGPAILSGRAAAVFFHEVLGHRLEGQRQRGDEEGQTFTKDVGKPILPDFLSVVDDPTLTTFGNTWLSGSYQYDDEGQKAERVDLIQDGVLKNFLMSRLPIASFAASNGHGRAETGHVPTGRQGNLIVTSTKTVSEAELRKELIDEAKKQGKPYGLYFEDISSGFAVTAAQLAAGLSGDSARRLARLCRWPPRRAGARRQHRRHAARRHEEHSSPPATRAKSSTASAAPSRAPSPSAPSLPPCSSAHIETQRQPQGTARPPILPIPGADSQAPAAKEAQ